jgi:Tol biopolymer transport system component
LVFSRFVPKGVDEIRNELFSSRPDGSDIKRLTFGHDNVFARWSAGGHRILYLRDGRVWMMGANGRHKQRIVGGDNFGGADWAPGGRRIVVARGIDRTTLVVHSLTTGVSRRLTGDYASPGHPRWSPDGKRILFEATSSPRTDVRDLYTIKPNGKGLRNLTSTTRFDEFDADWSPAGDRIVYVRDRIGPCQRLHVMRADGTRDRRIGRGCSDAEPTWSPNARRILFSPLDDRFGVSHLVVIALNGSHRHVVTEGQWPDWRP